MYKAAVDDYTKKGTGGEEHLYPYQDMSMARAGYATGLLDDLNEGKNKKQRSRMFCRRSHWNSVKFTLLARQQCSLSTSVSQHQKVSSPAGIEAVAVTFPFPLATTLAGLVHSRRNVRTLRCHPPHAHLSNDVRGHVEDSR